jgi:hypothetical protein
MKFKLITDGSLSGTQLLNAATGEVVGTIESMSVHLEVATGLAARMSLEITGDLHRRKDKPQPGFVPEVPTHPGKANAIPPPPSEAIFPKEAITKPTPKPGRYISAEGVLSTEAVPTGMAGTGPMEYLDPADSTVNPENYGRVPSKKPDK